MSNPIVVTLRLTARDADAFRAHLLSVIPVTRQAAGCHYSHSYQDPQKPTEFLLVQGWATREHQQKYLAWRAERGDLAQFRALLAADPVVETFALFDA